MADSDYARAPWCYFIIVLAILVGLCINAARADECRTQIVEGGVVIVDCEGQIGIGSVNSVSIPLAPPALLPEDFDSTQDSLHQQYEQEEVYRSRSWRMEDFDSNER